MRKKPLFEDRDEEVTKDLCKKVILDVLDTITRTLEIAPEPHSAIITAAGSAAVGMLASVIQKQADVPTQESGKPDDPALLLAALIIARFCIGRNRNDYIQEAIKDVDFLMKKKRFP